MYYLKILYICNFKWSNLVGTHLICLITNLNNNYEKLTFKFVNIVAGYCNVRYNFREKL